MSGNQKTIALFGVSNKDEAVIASLLDLVADRMSHRWIVDNREQNPDRILIDTCESKGESAWRTFEDRGAQRIALVNGEAPGDAQHILARPIRANQLIAILEQQVNPAPKKQSKAVSGATAGMRYRLKRWPDIKVIQSQPESTRLSAILVRHAMTITEVSRLTQITTEKVHQFINICQENGWILAELPTEVQPEFTSHNNSMGGLFSRIRARLGLRTHE